MSKYKIGDVLYSYGDKGELKKCEVTAISYDYFSEEYTIDLKNVGTDFEWFDVERCIDDIYFYTPEEALEDLKGRLQAKISYNSLAQQRMDRENIELKELLKKL